MIIPKQPQDLAFDLRESSCGFGAVKKPNLEVVWYYRYWFTNLSNYEVSMFFPPAQFYPHPHSYPASVGAPINTLPAHSNASDVQNPRTDLVPPAMTVMSNDPPTVIPLTVRSNEQTSLSSLSEGIQENPQFEDCQFEFSLHVDGPKEKRRRRGNTTRKTAQIYKCFQCGATETPEWRYLNSGEKVCNACGIKDKRRIARMNQPITGKTEKGARALRAAQASEEHQTPSLHKLNVRFLLDSSSLS